MNGPFQVAQASTPGTTNNNSPVRIFNLTKPLGDQAVTINLGYDQKVKVDFSAIANEKITLVHLGDKLIILFDNKSTLTLEPFFDSRHDGLNNLSVEVAPGRDVSVSEFASLFPITTDQSVLPAAGEGNGNAQASGANFSPSIVDPLGIRDPLALLGQEELGNFRTGQDQFDGTPTVAPTAGFTLSGVLLVHDETVGVQVTANDMSNLLLPAGFQTTGLIGWAQSASEIATDTSGFGTNGAGTVTYALTTAGGGAFAGVDSGLRATATGNEIFLFTEGAFIVAREGTGGVPNAAGAIAFELFLEPGTLKLDVAQYEAVSHGNALNSNDRIDLAGVVFVQQTVTDGLGGTATAVSTAPLGVAFDDDGPAILVTVAGSEGSEGQVPAHLGTLTLDESIGGDRGAAVPPSGNEDDTGFTTPDPTGTHPIGEVKSAAGEGDAPGALQALFNVVKDPGTDGEKSTTYHYSFSLTGGSGAAGGVASTLKVTDPTHHYGDDTIYLFKVSDTEVVGRVGNNPAGDIAIRITLTNAGSLSGGQLVVDQYMAIDHGNDGNNFDSTQALLLLGTGGDEGQGVSASLGVTLTATITDGDNDTATSSATVVIAGQAGEGQTSSIEFQDDGPAIVAEGSVTAIVDEDGLATGNHDAARPGELAGTGSAVATGSLAGFVDFGTDGPGANGFHLATQATPVDSGLLSQGGHVLIVSDGLTLHGYVETGAAGSGFGAGDREVFTLTIGADGSYTFTLKDQIDHPTLNGVAGDNTENVLTTTLDLSHYIVATDGDGDSITLGTGEFKIEIQDDIPVLTGQTVAVKVDEDDINTAWSHGTSPSDGNADGSFTEGSTGAAIVSGSLAGLVSVGADEPGTFGFSADAIAKLTALGLFSKETATGDGENGKLLTYALSSNAAAHEITITGNEPNPHGNPVFSLTVNTVTGDYEFRLYDELMHMPGGDQNTDLRSGQPVDGVQHSIPNLDLGSIVTFTDRDGDTVTLTGKFTVTVTDDVPHADIDLHGGSVTIDESAGNQADDTTSSSVRALFANLENSGIVGQDPDVPGDHNGGVAGNGAIAYAHSDFSVVIDDSIIGSDSPAYPHVFSLSVAGGNGTPSGLFVTDGSSIILSVNADGLVIGTVSGGAFNGKVAFAIAIESDGEVSVAQYLSIKHDDRGDSNETNDNGNNSNDASPDDALTIQQTLDGKIIATLTVTDSDGDKSSDSVNIGRLINFLDDGPTVDAHVSSSFVVVHDETPGVQSGDDDTTTQAVRDLFANVHDKGSDPDLTLAQKVDGAIGFAQSDVGALSVSVNFGADGPAVANSKVFALTLNGGNGTDSGIDTTDGKSIFLFKEGDLIVGRYDGPDGGSGVSNGIGGDPAAFAIAIDPVTGKVSVVQYVSLHHNSADAGVDSDEYVAIASNKIIATVTVTDGDGDPATDSADISGKIRFEDDGPTVSLSATTASIIQDETPGVQTTADPNAQNDVASGGLPFGVLALFDAVTNKGVDNDVNNALKDHNALGFATSSAPLVSVTANFGADGAATSNSQVLALAISGGDGTNSGLKTTDGHEIDLFLQNGLIVGRYDSNNSGHITTSDAAAFAIAIGQDGKVSIAQYVSLFNPMPGTSYDEAASGLKNIFATVKVTDGDGDTATSSVNISGQIQFQDDGPALTVTAPAAINGFDFGAFTLNNNEWGNGSGTATGTNGGWTIADANQGHGANPIANTGAGTVQLERVGDGYQGMHSSTGGYMVDLDASPHDVKISQVVTGLATGQTYDLRFEAGAPFPGQAHLEVWFGGVKVVPDVTLTGQMQEYKITLTGGSGDGSNLLEFRETGAPDNQGTYLANVSVGEIVIDETPGIQSDSNEVASLSLFTAIAHKGIDPDMAAQFAQGTSAAVSIVTDFGADGPKNGSAATATVYSLVATNNADSGLTTTAGQSIHLFNEGGFVVGRYDSNNSGTIDGTDDAAFAFAIDPGTGKLSLVQYVSLHQPNTASNDEGVFLNTGALSVKVTITDGDNDTITKSADISANVRFDDDGPHAVLTVAEHSVLTIDETAGPDAGTNDVAHADIATIKALLFSAIVADPIEIAQSSVAVVSTAGTVYGADGQGAAPVYALNVSSPNGVDSGLDATDGRSVFLFKEGNLIVGREGTAGDTADANGSVAFAISLDGSTGKLTVAEYTALYHHNPADPNESATPLTILNNVIQATVTVTDGDGDTSVASVGIGNQIHFLDDGPTIAAAPLNQIVNGDFSQGTTWSAPDWWGSASPSDVPGWALAPSPVGPGTVDLERTPDGLYGLHTSTGGYMVDLGSSPGNIQITQDFQPGALVAGQTYAIQFEAGAPFPDTAKLEVIWDGQVIGTIDPTGPMTSYNFIVTANGTSGDHLTFREIGLGDAPIPGDYQGHSYATQGYQGTYLANVKLVATYVVDEDGLPAGNHDLPAPSEGDAAGLATSVTGALGINWGADKYDAATPDAVDAVRFYQDNSAGVLTGRNVVFTNTDISVSGGTDFHNLTSHGDHVVISLTDSNTRLVGMATDSHGVTREVFEVSLSDDATGAFKFTLKDALDHAPNGSENDIDLTFNFTAADSDGDTAKGTFTVGIDDDVPVATGAVVNVTGEVYEDGLSTGNPEGAPGSQPVVTTITHANLASLVNFGADGPGGFGFNGAAEGTSSGLSSDGSAISYHIAGDTLSGITADGRTIFTLVDSHDGNFKFTLLGNVDHGPLNIGGGDSETLTLNLASLFSATDHDGDTVVLSGGLNVIIENDIPVVTANANLIVNGSFEDGHPDLGSGHWAVYHSLPGWSSADIGATGPAGDVPFEVQTGGVGNGVHAQDGDALIELDSDTKPGDLSGSDNFNDSGHTNATIQQVVHETVTGQTYELTFWYAPRPGEGDDNSGSMEVLWNGNVVKTIDSTGMTPGVWQQITVFVDGTGPDNVLGFHGTGQENSLGAFIDNVSLVAAAVVDEDGLPTGNHDSQPGDIVVPNGDLDGNEATATELLNIKWGADDFNGGADTHAGGDPAQGFVQDTSGRKVTFTDDHVSITGGALTSHGDTVVLSLSADGTVLTGTATHGSDAPRTVFEVSLSDDGSGAFRFILKDALDHTTGQNENNIVLSFNYTATDSDGDIAPGSFQVLVNDDMPVAAAEPLQTLVEGTALSGHFDFAAGADGATVTHVNGVALTFGVDGYSQPIATDHGTLAVKADGSYLFTAQADDFYLTGGQVTGTFTVTDHDGDTSTAGFSFAVTDDADVTTVTLSDVTVLEGAGTATILASVDHAPQGSDLVLSLSNGSTVTILAGHTTGTSTPFAVQGDDPYIDHESYVVSVTGATGGNYEALNTTDTSTVTVNDTINTNHITIDDVTVLENQTIVYTAHMDYASITPFSITLNNGVTLTFDPGHFTATSAPQPAQGDDVYLDGQVIPVSIASTSGGNFEAVNITDTATVTINDTIDPTTVSLSASDILENVPNATFTATLSNASHGDTIVTTDHGVITIHDGQTTGTLLVPTGNFEDPYVDPSTVTVAITGATGGNFEQLTVGIASATAHVGDTITPNFVTLDDVVVLENQSIVYTAHMDYASSTPFTITLSNGVTLTFDPGHFTATSAPQPAQGDDVYLDGQVIPVSIASTSGGNFEAVNITDTATVTINDTIDPTTVSLSASDILENVPNATFTATLSNASHGDTIVTTDHGVITIHDGQTTGTLLVPTGNFEDPYVDPSNVTVAITGATGGNFEQLTVGTASATAHVGDTITPNFVTLDDVVVLENQTLTYTAHMNYASSTPFTITLSNGVEITFDPGHTTASSAPQPAQGDDVYLDGQVIPVSIASTSGGNFEAVNITDTATVTITDTIDNTTVTLTATPSITEAGTSITYTATLDHPAQAGSPVTVTLSNGEIITIAGGTSSGQVVHAVVPNEDVYIDPTSVSATIATATGGNFEHLVINPAAATTQITDTIDNTTVTLTATPSITEAGTSITYTATLDHPAQAGSPVTVTLSNGEIITIGGGTSSGQVVHAVVPNEDVYIDPTSVSAAIATATGGNFEHLVINPAAATTQIIDTIDNTTVTLTATPSITEAGTSITYTATLDHPAQAGSPVTVTLSNGEIITIGGGTSSGQVVHAVVPNEDVYIDPTSVSATIATATGGNFEHLVINPAAATTQITDTINPVTATLTTSTPTISETGGTITYVVTLSSGISPFTPKSDLTFTLTNGETVTVLAGQTSGSTTHTYTDANITNQVSITDGITGVTGGGAYESLLTTGTTNVPVFYLPKEAGSASLTVDEASLDTTKAGNDILAGLVTGSNSSSTTETAQSTALTFTAGSDNITAIAFGATAGISVTGATGSFAWVLNGSGQLEGHIGNSAGPIGIILAISGTTTAAAGGTATPTITATLTDNFPHTTGAGNVVVTGITVVASDASSHNVSGAVSVTITDDVPHANPDTALTVLETAVATSGVNLLANDAQGADGAKVTGVDFGDGGGLHAIAASGTTTLTTSNGIYTFQADGTWTFDPSVNPSNSNTTGNFTYTITDGDGDTSAALQTVNITNANSIPVAGTDSFTVNEDGLTGGIAGGPGDVGGTTISHGGTLPANFGADGAASSGAYNFTQLSGAVLDSAGHAVTSGGVALSYFWDNTGHVLYASTNVSSLANAQATEAFTVSLNTTTGAYTYTEIKPIDHPGHDADGANNGPETAYEDNLTINIGYQVTDSNGDHAVANGTLAVTINDDSPKAFAESASASEQVVQNVNAAFVVDMSGSIDGTEYSQMMAAVKAAGDQLFTDATGTVKLELVAFGSTALAAGPFTTQAAFDTQMNDWISNRPISSSTDYSDAIQTLMNNYTAVAGANNQVFFLSDGNPNENTGSGGESLNDTVRPAWNTFVNNPTAPITVTTIGVGNGLDTAHLSQVDVDSGSHVPVTVAQFSDLIDTLATLVGNNVTGNVLSNGDGFGADGGRILSITFNGHTYTWNGKTDGTASIAVTDSNNVALAPISGTSLNAIGTGLTGKFTFYFVAGGGHAAGDWVYTGPQELVATTNETFTYVLTDNDGDTASAALTVTVTAVNDAPVNTVPAAQSVAEDIGLVFTGAGKTISIADVDAGSGTETVTLGVLHGTLNLGGLTGLTGISGNGTGSVTFTGSITDVNNALNGLTYKGVQNYNGADTLTITTNDNGNTGSGGAKSDTDTVAITVTAVNDAPVAANDTGAATEKSGVSNGTAGSNATGSVLTNDTDVDSSIAVASFRTGGTEGAGTAGTLGSGLVGAHGTLTLGSNGNYTYVINENDSAVQALNVGQSTTDTFNYTVTDGSLTDTATLTITINGANDAPVVSAAAVDSSGHISFTIADPDNSSLSLLNSPAGVAAAFGTPTLVNGVNTLAVPTALGTATGFTLQVSDGSASDDVMGVYLGSTGDNNITLPVSGGVNAIYGFGGNDSVNLASGAVVAGTYIDGGTGTDTINLTTTGDNRSLDLTGATLASIENLVAVNQGSNSGYNQTFTITAAQWAGLSSIDMNDGTDTLNVVINGAVDISSSGSATIADTETVNVTGTTGADSLTLTGTQLNALLAANASIDLGGGTDAINLTSTSTGLNNLSDGRLINVETVSVSTAATINLGNQTESININGSGGNDIITAATGGGTINVGLGADTVTINAGSVTNKSWTVDLGADNAADKVVYSHTALGIGDNAVVTVNNFHVADDKVAVTLNGTAIADGAFQTVTGTQTAITGEVIELVANGFVTSSLTDDANSGAIETIIAAATNGIAIGNYTFIIYSNTTGTADAGIYTVNITDPTDPAANGGMTVEHIMTLNGVGYGNLTDANFVQTSDPIVLDLGNSGLAFTTQESGVAFDINGDGVTDQVAWTVNGGDGILALDVNGSGKIESGNELFTPTFAGGQFANGIAALASLDTNHDGVIDSHDPAFSQLVVWQDANHNGVSDSGELAKLSDLGIKSIDLATTAGTGPIDGQNIAATGSFTYVNGSKGSFVEADLDTSLGKLDAPATGADSLHQTLGGMDHVVDFTPPGHGELNFSAINPGVPAGGGQSHFTFTDAPLMHDTYGDNSAAAAKMALAILQAGGTVDTAHLPVAH